jgi:hypothetical protein
MAKTIKRGFKLEVEHTIDGKPIAGVHYARPGYAPLSGLCSTVQAAKAAALKAS